MIFTSSLAKETSAGGMIWTGGSDMGWELWMIAYTETSNYILTFPWTSSRTCNDMRCGWAHIYNIKYKPSSQEIIACFSWIGNLTAWPSINDFIVLDKSKFKPWSVWGVGYEQAWDATFGLMLRLATARFISNKQNLHEHLYLVANQWGTSYTIPGESKARKGYIYKFPLFAVKLLIDEWIIS